MLEDANKTAANVQLGKEFSVNLKAIANMGPYRTRLEDMVVVVPNRGTFSRELGLVIVFDVVIIRV